MCCHGYYRHTHTHTLHQMPLSDIVAAFDLIIRNHASTIRLGVL